MAVPQLTAVPVRHRADVVVAAEVAPPVSGALAEATAELERLVGGLDHPLLTVPSAVARQAAARALAGVRVASALSAGVAQCAADRCSRSNPNSSPACVFAGK